MIARLAAAHRQGRLVPFLGAGMSVPACPGWGAFVKALERQVLPAGKGAKSAADSEALIRRANNAVRQLRLRGSPPFASAVSQALHVDPPRQRTPQTDALVQLYWPLVLTSNYDGLFLRAWNEAHAGTSEMEVLGRSPGDCRHVLSSLHASRPPILWALQGYVGELSRSSSRQLLRFVAIDYAAQRLRPRPGTEKERGPLSAMAAQAFQGFNQARSATEALRSAKQRELEQQLVVGHEEYRRVTHTEPQFRRAFAEVFRSRSLFFVGSSLTDQYLLNLFGETLEIFGSNPFPHYAFVLKGTTDPEFLRTRLNTFVYEYASHGELPQLLTELSESVEKRSARMRTWSYAVATSVRSAEHERAADVHIVRGDLPSPGKSECVALGVSVVAGGKIMLEGSTESVLERFGCLTEARNLLFSPGERVQRVPDRPVFLVAMTTHQGQQDLRQYARSITALLEAVAATDFRLLRTRLPLRDQRSGWLARIAGNLGGFFGALRQVTTKEFPQRFWLMEILRAYGAWRRREGNPGTLELFVHLTDPGILFDMSTGRIDPLELLMCDDLRFTVEVERDAATLIAESYQCEGTMTLGGVARQLGILSRVATASEEQWLVAVDPSPTGMPQVLALSEETALGRTLAELGVLPDSVLRFVRIAMPPAAAESKQKGKRVKPVKKRASASKKK